jgi:hypothetical protein
MSGLRGAIQPVVYPLVDRAPGFRSRYRAWVIIHSPPKSVDGYEHGIVGYQLTNVLWLRKRERGLRVKRHDLLTTDFSVYMIFEWTQFIYFSRCSLGHLHELPLDSQCTEAVISEIFSITSQ